MKIDSSKILYADDDDSVRKAVHMMLEVLGYQVLAVASGQEAVDLVREDFDVIILDINMPKMDGFETIKLINKKNLGIPVLFLTGVGSMENAIKALNLGAYDFINKPIGDLDLFNLKIQRAIEKRTYVLNERAYKANLEAEVLAKTRELAEKNVLLEKYSRHLEVATLNIILSLQTAMEAKDVYTAGHTIRVTEYAMMIGRHMQLADAELRVLERAAQLHDVGKLVIDTTAIAKPGPLTADEWDQIRKHTLVGENIISRLGFLDQESKIIKLHHERVDGRGYPFKVDGRELDILTKIITVADSFDAMTSKRAYKKNKTWNEAIQELLKCSGSQFDPEVVRTFIDVLRESEKNIASSA